MFVQSAMKGQFNTLLMLGRVLVNAPSEAVQKAGSLLYVVLFKAFDNSFHRQVSRPPTNLKHSSQNLLLSCPIPICLQEVTAMQCASIDIKQWQLRCPSQRQRRENLQNYDAFAFLNFGPPIF